MTEVKVTNNLDGLLAATKSTGRGSSRSSSSSGDFAEILSGSKEQKDDVSPRDQSGTVKSRGFKEAPTPALDRMDRIAPVEARSPGVPDVPQPESAIGKLERNVSEEAVDNLNHRQALQTMLKKMKDEVGVDATDILAAIATLTPTELMQPPQMNLEKIIGALNLAPSQQLTAKVIFSDMLKQTAQTSMVDYLKTSNRQLSLEVLSRQEASRKNLNRTLAEMQSQFFQSPYGNVKSDNSISNPSAPLIDSEQGNPNNETVMKSQPFGLVPLASDGAVSVPVEMQPASGTSVAVASTPVTAHTAPPSQLKSEPVSEVVNTGDSEIEVTEESSGEWLQTLQDSSMTELAEPTNVSAPATPTSTPDAPAGVVSGIQAGGTLGERNGSELSDQESNRDQEGLRDGVAVHGADRMNSPARPESFVVATRPTPVQEAGNVREVIQRAQFMAQKGGGEMKVSLSPEGLGQVAMKVAVKNGQVNIEMIADTMEAKKVLERGLGDLKSSLMANNLKVDHIRIDTPADVSRQLTQQHDEAQRQFAQQFMEQFRQDNNEWRRGFYDIAGARTYQSQKEAVGGNNTIYPESGKRRDGSRRLDLVA